MPVVCVGIINISFIVIMIDIVFASRWCSGSGDDDAVYESKMAMLMVMVMTMMIFVAIVLIHHYTQSKMAT